VSGGWEQEWTLRARHARRVPDGSTLHKPAMNKPAMNTSTLNKPTLNTSTRNAPMGGVLG